MVDAGEHFGFRAGGDVLVGAAEKRSPCCSEVTGVGEYDWNCGVQEVERVNKLWAVVNCVILSVVVCL
jgi:hypothetical protein